MKQLKDYLHLYLGCDVIVNNNLLEVLKLVHVTIKENGFVFCNYGKGLGAYYSFEQVKPILRPLSDMTEEEDSELSEIQLGDYGKNGVIISSAIETKYLLSKHFDLFGLIESGLAMDKTKQPA